MLRPDLRAVLRRCRPDRVAGGAEQRAAWTRGDRASFFPYAETEAPPFAEQE